MMLLMTTTEEGLEVELCKCDRQEGEREEADDGSDRSRAHCGGMILDEYTVRCLWYDIDTDRSIGTHSVTPTASP